MIRVIHYWNCDTPTCIEYTFVDLDSEPDGWVEKDGKVTCKKCLEDQKPYRSREIDQ